MQRISRTVYHLALCAIIWVGFALSLRLLDRFPLRADEAIYSFWALHFWRVDPFFLQVWPDKPPLFLWLLAVLFQLWGANQATGRLLNAMLTLLTALVVGAIARRLWGQRSGLITPLIATALYLLNPFVLSFAPTVYTDPLLVLAGQLAFFWALTGRSLGAGFWLAVAIMTKQQGLLYVPLILGTLWLGQRLPTKGSPVRSINLWLRFGGGALVVLAPVCYWDSLRWAVAPSPWDLSMRHYGALQLVVPALWLTRSSAWAKLLWYFTASWPVWLLLASVLVGAFWQRVTDLRSLQDWGSWRIRRWMNPPPDRPSPLKRAFLCQLQVETWSWQFASRILRDVRHVNRVIYPGIRKMWGDIRAPQRDRVFVWLALWSIGFGLFHVMTSVQIWDRYLLPLAPPFCLLLAWAMTQVAQTFLGKKGARWVTIASLVSLLSLVPPALAASRGDLPIGGDHGDYTGLTEAIAWLKREAPAGAVLYHQQLGWQYQFYLYDELAAGVYELRWFPSATYLADNGAKIPYRPRFLVQPDWALQPDLALHLAVHQIQLIATARFGRMILYTLQNQPQARCAWCLCQGQRPWPIWDSRDLPWEPTQP